MTDQHPAQATAAGGSQTLVDTVVKDHPAEHRYEITVAGRLAGFAAYLDRPGGEGGGQRRVFIHTEIDPNYEGQGLAGVLVKAALADVRAPAAGGGRLPYVSAYVKRHPEEADIVDRATPAILSSLEPATSSMTAQDVDVLVIGAGLGGIGAAWHLQHDGPGTSFAILEARDAIGGTWDLFRFPRRAVRLDHAHVGPPVPTVARHRGLRERRGDLPLPAGDRRRIRHRHPDPVRAQGDSRRVVFHGRTVDTRRACRWARETWTCAFLYSCTGYYDYAAGYTPHLAGADDFRGEVVHLQFWPGDLDVRGRRVAVIGSGATAVTLVPALADAGAEVTMVQRSPSWVAGVDRQDPLAARLRRWLPDRVVDSVMRTQSAAVSIGMYEVCRRAPRVAAAYLRRGMRRVVGEAAVAEHFTPRYRPWAQRLCIAPGNDFLHTVADGRLSSSPTGSPGSFRRVWSSVRVVSSSRTSS